MNGSLIMDESWRKFIVGPLYADSDAPWRTDPAYQFLLQFSGLRDAVGGQVAPALTQAVGLVQALAQVDLHALARQHRPALGLCLGFGMNMFEPYDLLQVFALDCVHAYEWIGEHVVEAAQSLHAFKAAEYDLSARIRLHHGTMSDLGALAGNSVRVAYVANVFNPEIPMAPETFSQAVSELLRVLEREGVIISRGSSGVFEEALAGHGKLLLQMPLVSVFQKRA
jgi:hypothetical protein